MFKIKCLTIVKYHLYCTINDKQSYRPKLEWKQCLDVVSFASNYTFLISRMQHFYLSFDCSIFLSPQSSNLLPTFINKKLCSWVIWNIISVQPGMKNELCKDWNKDFWAVLLNPLLTPAFQAGAAERGKEDKRLQLLYLSQMLLLDDPSQESTEARWDMIFSKCSSPFSKCTLIFLRH